MIGPLDPDHDREIVATVEGEEVGREPSTRDKIPDVVQAFIAAMIEQNDGKGFEEEDEDYENMCEKRPQGHILLGLPQHAHCRLGITRWFCPHFRFGQAIPLCSNPHSLPACKSRPTKAGIYMSMQS
ncbi:MAG: hypothetical protein ACRCWS_04795 [Propionibacteriaceae bacterium]